MPIVVPEDQNLNKGRSRTAILGSVWGFEHHTVC